MDKNNLVRRAKAKCLSWPMIAVPLPSRSLLAGGTILGDRPHGS